MYEGYFENGAMSGEGVYKVYDPLTQSYSEAQGVWRNGNFHGVGYAKDLEIKSFNVNVGYYAETLLDQYVSSSKKDEFLGAKKKYLRGRYTGPLLGGLPSGSDGLCVYEDSSEYQGEWKSGRRNGMGVYRYANLDEYFGKWVGDKRCGNGRWVSTVANEREIAYDGQWEDNVPHGEGMMQYQDKSVYVGNFKAGKRVDYGKLTDGESNRVVYDGMWTNDQPAS